VREEHLEDKPRRRGRRMTSPERWEISQLIKSGVLDVSEYPEFNEEEGGLVQEEEEVWAWHSCFGRYCFSLAARLICGELEEERTYLVQEEEEEFGMSTWKRREAPLLNPLCSFHSPPHISIAPQLRLRLRGSL
jgi:hypothetical protein